MSLFEQKGDNMAEKYVYFVRFRAITKDDLPGEAREGSMIYTSPYPVCDADALSVIEDTSRFMVSGKTVSVRIMCLSFLHKVDPDLFPEDARGGEGGSTNLIIRADPS